MQEEQQGYGTGPRPDGEYSGTANQQERGFYGPPHAPTPPDVAPGVPSPPDQPRKDELDALGLSSILDSDAVTRLRQLALLNLGEMNAVKVNASFDSPLDHGEFSDAFLAAVRAVYVRPTGGVDFDDLYKSWKHPGSITVLAEGPGKGRTTMGRALLAELRHEYPGVRAGQLNYGGFPEFPVHRLPRPENWAYVMELPPDEEDFKVSDTFGALLESLQAELARRKARLVVLTTPEQWRRIGSGAPEGIRPSLGVPPPIEIARKWLHAEAPELPVDRWLRDEDILTLLEGQPPVEVLEIVGYILDAHRANDTKLPNLKSLAHKLKRGTDTPFDRQVLSVLAARSNWRSQLLEWHKAPERTSFQRNFLMSCSALRGAPVAHLYAGAADLSEALGDGDLSLRGQREPGVIEMVDSLDAELQPDDTVVFNRPDWDDAALDYFWIDRPLSRTKFLDWLAGAPLKEKREALESLSAQEQQAMAQRIGGFAVRWAVRQRRQDPLRVLAVRWKDKPLWPTLIELLTSASLHTASASYVHEMLLQWAKTGTAAQRLAAVEVCAGEFGLQYTVKALRRLRHAAGSEDREVRQALQRAVQTLWHDPTARPTLFEYVVAWCGEANTLEAGQKAFRTLTVSTDPASPALPVLLASDGESGFKPSATDLTTGWRAVLHGNDTFERDGEDALAVRLWLDAVRHYPDLKDSVLTILSAAVKDTTDDGQTDITTRPVESPRDRLRAIVREWARAGEDEELTTAFDVPPHAPSHSTVYTEVTQMLDDGLLESFQQSMADPDVTDHPV
ncbi:hypothetical protein [Streptomyces sp. NRRL S-337]|uniref:hypothetical protein n=1 Tax=Streptomyces sp. NRRL S-337 TaxID=1463900 RepID=UPI000B06A2CA|nr:hypothetical protein [Streptomyces sp. NRRL S-337]